MLHPWPSTIKNQNHRYDIAIPSPNKKRHTVTEMEKNMIETTNQLWLQENNVMLNVHFISNKKTSP